MKYTLEKILDPQWYKTHKTHHGTKPTEFNTLQKFEKNFFSCKRALSFHQSSINQ